MNNNNFEQHVNAPYTVEPFDQAANTPMVDTPGEVVDANSVTQEHVYEPPVAGTFSAITPTGETVVYEAPAGGNDSHEEPQASTTTPEPLPLLEPVESEHLRTRWNEIQGKFVDEPRQAVQQADALVAEVIGQITKMFGSETDSLESQWKQGSDVSTEDLRKVLQRYRAFFNRLVG